MLTEPRHGWSEFRIKDFKRQVSYITDVPVDCLNAFINGLTNNKPVSIYFDMEGSSFILLSTKEKAYIILDENEMITIEYDETMLNLSKQLLKDIQEHLDKWVNWFDYHIYDIDKTYFNKRTLMLETLCYQLEKAIKIEEER